MRKIVQTVYCIWRKKRLSLQKMSECYFETPQKIPVTKHSIPHVQVLNSVTATYSDNVLALSRGIIPADFDARGRALGDKAG